jgi:hypothetical protein
MSVNHNIMESRMDNIAQQKCSGFELFARKQYHTHLEELESLGVGLITFDEYVSIHDDIITEKWNAYLIYCNECD